MDFQTLQRQINLPLSELCAVHYNTVRGAWHQPHNAHADIHIQLAFCKESACHLCDL